MFNPHIHQQQQQFQQHLRQLQQLLQQQQQPPPPPPPQPPPGHHVPHHHHHQTQRAIPGPPQTAPTHRMVNMCQATQTAIMAPNHMLQGALLMQQMQGNMLGFGMAGQQFRQFFAAGARSSLLGPVPMGMALKSPMMGFPAARTFHPHARYYNNTPATASTAASSASFSSPVTAAEAAAAHQTDRKRDSEQMAAVSTDNQPDASSTHEHTDKTETDGAVGEVEGPTHSSEEQLDEPVLKKLRTEGPEDSKVQCAVQTVSIMDTDGDVLSSELNSNTEDSQDCILLEDRGSDVTEELEESRPAEEQSSVTAASPSDRQSVDEQQGSFPLEEMSVSREAPVASPDHQEEGEEGVAEGNCKFYCYLCSITCPNQQNFKSHMNSVCHQQRMMEIQHMSNACLVTLLQGANKDNENKVDPKHWCATCHTHFTSNLADHCLTEEHKLASRAAVPSCTVCKKHFRTSHIFLEHLQSQEHRQKVDKLQHYDGCEDTDGFTLEEVDKEEDRQGNDGDQVLSDRQGCWSSIKEMNLKDMASDEQYDPDTVYGSSFFVPVTGFICKLCNKFYHFDSSALPSHCKSLTHFENLKRHRASLSQKGGAVESSRDSLRPETEPTTDCSDGSHGTCLATDLNYIQPNVTLDRLTVPSENNQQQEEQTPLELTVFSASETTTENTEQDLSLSCKDQEEKPVELQDANDANNANDANDANIDEGGTGARVVPGKKNSGRKAKPKRRSARAAKRH